MIANDIPETHKSLEERGIPSESYFRVVFEDGSEVDEKKVSWSSFSSKKEVMSFGIKKFVRVSWFPVKRIEAFHEGLHSFIDVPEGHEVYQAIRSETLIIPTAEPIDKIIGRIIGLVKDGEVVEEHFLNAQQFIVEGRKK